MSNKTFNNKSVQESEAEALRDDQLLFSPYLLCKQNSCSTSEHYELSSGMHASGVQKAVKGKLKLQGTILLFNFLINIT